MRITLAAGLIALLVPACIVGPGEISGVGDDEMEEGGETGGGTGGGNGGGSGTTATPRVVATVDKATMPTELGKTELLTLTLTSENGFTGSVPIMASMTDGATALSGFTMTATPATVDLAAGGTATVSISVKIPTDAAALATQLKLDLGGSAPTSVTSSLAITNKLTINIPAGTGAGAHSGLPAVNAPIKLRPGAMVVFHNSDNMQHVVHASGGIAHENTTAGGMPNSDYEVTPNGDATWYCHSHEGSGQSRIINLQ